jgi:hypothetical protein
MTAVLELLEIRDRHAFNLARWKEICVEVLSPGNTRGEMDEKRELLFEAGAEEMWICDEKGRMFFFMKHAPAEAAGKSILCPDFPDRVG